VTENQQPAPKPQANPKPRDSGANDQTFQANESRRKRQTIHIKLPRKPAAPRSSMKATTVAVRVPRNFESTGARDLPLRITAFTLLTLLVIAYFHFFSDTVRHLPIEDYLPAFLSPQIVHKLLGMSLLAGFALFEITRKTLSTRLRWVYCVLLGLGVAFFVVQWAVNWRGLP
jgi:hypothetical protein